MMRSLIFLFPIIADVTTFSTPQPINTLPPSTIPPPPPPGELIPPDAPAPGDTTRIGKLGEETANARAEGSHFLNLLDQYQYGSAWRDAGPLLKECITEDQWIGAMEKTRRPLGNVRTRRSSAQVTEEILPFGTRGYFIVLRFDSQFSAVQSVTEELIMMRDDLGRFRAIHYSATKK